MSANVPKFHPDAFVLNSGTNPGATPFPAKYLEEKCRQELKRTMLQRQLDEVDKKLSESTPNRTINDLKEFSDRMKREISELTKHECQPSLFSDVVEFHDKFGVQNPTKNEDHQLDFRMQRFKLEHLQEELNEYRLAVHEGDMETAFDSLIDLVYVALGAAHAHRFPFNEGWKRVHAANMTKKIAESAQESKRGFKRDIVKPEGFVPPTLGDLL